MRIHSFRHVLLFGAAVFGSAIGVTAAAPAYAQEAMRAYDIPPQALDDALREFARKTGRDILFAPATVADKRSALVHGQMTERQALDALLAGTSLHVERTSSNGYAVQDPQSPTQGGATAAAQSSDEIVVTAQKREERLRDVPVPVTAVDTQALAETNAVLLRDFFAAVPGLNLNPRVQSVQTLSIRGITTGSGNPTVGIVVDGVPYSGSTNFAGGRVAPDIDPGDLARVEVLRGPQGTLYGASSMGGLVNFITTDPSPDALSGQVQGSVNSIENADGAGTSLRGSINAPLGKDLALRASAFNRHDAGFIDNVQTGETGANAADARGARLGLRWAPSDTFSLRLNALAQEVNGDGAGSVDPSLGDLRQSRTRNTGWYQRNAEAYSAVATANFGDVEVVSVTGFNANSYHDSFDFSYSAFLSGQALSNFGVTGVALESEGQTDKWTQEIRVTAPLTERIDLLLGGFYTDEDSLLVDQRYAVNPATGAYAGRMLRSAIPTTFEERALFATLTVRLSDVFDIQAGARTSEIEQSFEQRTTAFAGATTTTGQLNTSSDSFTFLVTPRWRITPDVMAYGRIASGYRAGGSNLNAGTPAAGSGVIPTTFDPDTSTNYELGLKGSFFDGVLSLDASLYHIDWDDIQVSLVSPSAFTYTDNGASAVSEGLELAVGLRPRNGLTLNGWVVWTQAELNENFPTGSSVFGVKGNRLPNTAEFSAHLDVEQEFSLGATLRGFVGGEANFVGDRLGVFTATSTRQTLDEYTQINLRTGIRADDWTATLFLNNAGDERGRLDGGVGANPPFAFVVIQPRTVGLTLSRSF